MLEFVARKLSELNEELVYLGGCTTGLFITDPLSLDVRPTKDVDCIVDIVSRSDYYKFAKKLKEKGFKQLISDSIICRWHHDDIILDVMPTDEKILTFGNRWYKKAIKAPVIHQLAEDLFINSVTAPYLLATKIEAFNSRGNKDFLSSHDFEDIITIIAGRAEIVAEIATSGAELKYYFKNFFELLLKNIEFMAALPGHLNDGPLTMQRVTAVLKRIKDIARNE